MCLLIQSVCFIFSHFLCVRSDAGPKHHLAHGVSCAHYPLIKSLVGFLIRGIFRLISTLVCGCAALLLGVVCAHAPVAIYETMMSDSLNVFFFYSFLFFSFSLTQVPAYFGVKDDTRVKGNSPGKQKLLPHICRKKKKKKRSLIG